jgi:hypothetical protein
MCLCARHVLIVMDGGSAVLLGSALRNIVLKSSFTHPRGAKQNFAHLNPALHAITVSETWFKTKPSDPSGQYQWIS